MKRLITFFAGLMLIVTTCATLFLCAAISSAGKKLTVDTYFFQPDNLSTRRIGVPAAASDLGDDAIRDMLIEKFVTEYFYAVPDSENIARRMAGRTAMRQLSSAAVFDAWTETVATEIVDLAEDKAMRLVHIADISLPAGSEYWIVQYTLATWLRPNDMFSGPVLADGVVYLKIIYEPGIRERNPGSNATFDVKKYLEKGNDPAGVFRFLVTDVQDSK